MLTDFIILYKLLILNILLVIKAHFSSQCNFTVCSQACPAGSHNVLLLPQIFFHVSFQNFRAEIREKSRPLNYLCFHESGSSFDIFFTTFCKNKLKCSNNKKGLSSRLSTEGVQKVVQNRLRT